MNIRLALKRALNTRGGALIMAIVTITVLVLLGLAVITVSMGTLKSNRADAATNDAFYAAESGVNSGLDQLRLEVSCYYAQMLNAEGATYTGLFNSFASKIATNAQTNFAKPDIAGGDTNTAFSVAGHQSSGDIYEFLVSSVSTMTDGTKYKVEGRLKVKRVDVSAKSWFVEDVALAVGETLDIGTTNNLGLKVYGQKAKTIVNTVSFYRPPNSSKAFEAKEGAEELTIDKTIGSRINDVLEYPSYSDPVITSPKSYLVQDTTIGWSNVPAYPVKVETAPGISITFSSSSPVVPAGVIHSKKNITIAGGGGPYNPDMYCDGDFTGSNCIVNGDIYCRGNVLLTHGTYNGDIYCDGSVTMHNATINGSVICKNNITVYGATALGSLFAGGTIQLNNLNASGNVIYSKTKIVFANATLRAIVFSGGDIEFSGSGANIYGASIIDDNATVKQGCWPEIHYNAAEVQQKLDAIKGTFFDPYKGGGAASLDTGVFREQSITAIGRIN